MPALLQFDGPDLEALLDKVRVQGGPEARIVRANKVRAGGIGGFFAREKYEVVAEVPESGETIDEAIVEVAPERHPEPEPVATSVLDLADRVNDEERQQAPSVSTETTSFASVLDRIANQVDDERPRLPKRTRTVAPAAPAPTRAPVRAVRPPAAAPAVVDVPTTQLVRLGLPKHLVPNGATDDPTRALLQGLAELPVPPPLPVSKGSVLAIAGEGRTALKVARGVADELDLDPSQIVVATARKVRGRKPAVQLLDDPDTAAERRRSWQRRSKLTIVVVDAAPGSRDTRWADSLLTALEPEVTWAVAEATRKPEDVELWASDLGGVDALAIEDVATTSSPAAILRTGIPVARLDGRKATPALWAAVLADRLAA